MTAGKRIMRSIAAAGAAFGGIDIFQDCGAVYAAELEMTEQDEAGRLLAEWEKEAETSTCEGIMGSESLDRTWPHSESLAEGAWMESEAMTVWEEPGFPSSAREMESRHESIMEMPKWQQTKSAVTCSSEAHYTEEWSPTHGYRGLGNWELTRKAVETACTNAGLELSREELNLGANIWFYSGVTLQYFDEPYGAGWSAFVSWFQQVAGIRMPDFGEEDLAHIGTSLNATATSEGMPPLSVKAE